MIAVNGFSIAEKPDDLIRRIQSANISPAIALIIFTNTFNRISDTAGDFLSVKEALRNHANRTSTAQVNARSRIQCSTPES
ncbi:hypothetical protein [Paraburkholderia sp. PGU19]|uniref:hypothetical protein n=1 Tax=Paraburkholderia sp. PGU19 TaxID=2735434 RepID=UPI0015DAAF7D|nr:hypothetical protein [Paraburkholderia sp. PGU19]